MTTGCSTREWHKGLVNCDADSFKKDTLGVRLRQPESMKSRGGLVVHVHGGAVCTLH